ncbi:conserved protein of unknown function [Legionella fallonii LLAP-10]|uniref:Pesticin C-terminal domain-containing protein n=1 Tax=Legionella fallonii LLAP-10 TaxID=1212491 RepID=A0A098G245_9GAMM|nr:conserved protein of unknown function [Legionella fallonii LLAP-10]
MQGYLPIKKKTGTVIGRSGITFATGFDLGQNSASDIKKFNFPKELEEKLLPFVGAQREDAKKLLPLAERTFISFEEANLIDFKVKGLHLRSAIKRWDAHRSENTPAFRDLTSGQQIVLFSRTFHQGRRMPDLLIAQKFYRAALDNNWVEAEKHLRNYNVPEGWYKDRVNKEADVLKRERLLK